MIRTVGMKVTKNVSYGIDFGRSLGGGGSIHIYIYTYKYVYMLYAYTHMYIHLDM